MAKGHEQPYQYLDIPQDVQHPVAWSINDYPHRTTRHFDIHVGLEIGIVLRGASQRWYDDCHFETHRGQIWFAGLWELHGFEVLRPGTRHLVLQVLPEFLDMSDTYTFCNWLEIFRQPPATRPRAQTAADRAYALGVAQAIVRVIRSENPYWLVRLRMILHQFLLYFMEKQVRQSVAAAPSGSFADRQNLLPALLLVEKRPQHKVSLSEASQAAHMSRSKFAAVFHQTMGVSFGQYGQRRRLAGAMRDLCATKLKLLAIAKRWGFSDAPHFVRSFKAATGQTPQEYRVLCQSRRPNRGNFVALPIPKIKLSTIFRPPDAD